MGDFSQRAIEHRRADDAFDRLKRPGLTRAEQAEYLGIIRRSADYYGDDQDEPSAGIFPVVERFCWFAAGAGFTAALGLFTGIV